VCSSDLDGKTELSLHHEHGLNQSSELDRVNDPVERGHLTRVLAEKTPTRRCWLELGGRWAAAVALLPE